MVYVSSTRGVRPRQSGRICDSRIEPCLVAQPSKRLKSGGVRFGSGAGETRTDGTGAGDTPPEPIALIPPRFTSPANVRPKLGDPASATLVAALIAIVINFLTPWWCRIVFSFAARVTRQGERRMQSTYQRDPSAFLSSAPQRS